MSKPYKVRWDQKSGAAANARRELPRLVAGYFARVRELVAEDPPPGELHAIRLETKKVRYTLELFRACYGPGLEKRMGALRRLQQLLGDVNDYTSSEQLIEASMRDSPMRVRIGRFLQERAAATALEFRKEWAAFDAPEQEVWWTRYLSRNAR